MRTSSAVLFLVLAFGTAFAQQEMQMQQQQQRSAPGEPLAKNGTPKLTKEQHKQAIDLLKQAEGQIGALEPASRVLACVQLAQAWQAEDRAHSIKLLEQAYEATRAIEAETPSSMAASLKRQIQNSVLQQLMALAPERVDGLLPELDPEVRAHAVEKLLDYYDSHKMLPHAIEVIEGIAGEKEMPYRAAGQLMQRMTPDQAEDFRRLFNESFASYQQHDHAAQMGDGFPEMLVAFHERILPDQLIAAIEEVLAQASKADDKANQPVTVGLALSKGSIQLSSRYDYRLFQLLPVLRTVDSGKADKLLKEHQELQPFLAQYPQGTESLRDQEKGANPLGGGMSTSFSIGGAEGGRGSNAPGGVGLDAEVLDQQRQAQVVKDSTEHPDNALANAPLISDPAARAGAYLGIAQENWKKHPSVARTALGKVMDMLGDIPLEQQMLVLRKTAQLYLRLEDQPSARKVLDKGMDLGSKLLKSDSNAEDPNTAPKMNWPSANAWRAMLELAVDVSPALALELLKQIDDDDLRTLAMIAIARTMLGGNSNRFEVMTFRKKSASIMDFEEN